MCSQRDAADGELAKRTSIKLYSCYLESASCSPLEYQQLFRSVMEMTLVREAYAK